MDSGTVYVVNRSLVERDLDRIASSLSPLIVSLLESMLEAGIAQLEDSPAEIGLGPLKMRVGPMVAKLVRSQGRDSLPPRASVAAQLSAGMRRLLTLSDPALGSLCEVAAVELGAWVGQAEPLPDDAWAGAGALLRTLADATD